MRKLFAVLIVLNFLSCVEKQKHTTTLLSNNFVLVDTSFAPNKFLELNNENSYPIYYLGLIKDTIRIGFQYSVKRPNWKEYDFLATAYTTTPKNLSLFVDTNYDLNCPIDYFNLDRSLNEDSTNNYHSFLFVLKNIGDSTLNLGISFYLLRVHKEVKNKNGDWIPLDKQDGTLFCGTGQPDIFLFKNEVLISKIRRYNGDTIAEFRMAYGFSNLKVYSNTFYDKFDKKAL